ncbi:D-alanyl-D-alanine carboxypeptidase family protein [Tritonibacter scottomollicae]|uniref:D-alanyl-D-alanine carboxypeptidase n=1 Tax=Tritonibacter scottomollicae TaxID=483013 RepID=A0A2T1AMV4_TRISK|nr:D-alanyl-D-alanine carboxypeptidase family protein [Tritonibacter scottomollicae]PRZ49930.1 D-alanyl-D-alanine carboxypeptidase [Tritonibacter scottomollicae]
MAVIFQVDGGRPSSFWAGFDRVKRRNAGQTILKTATRACRRAAQGLALAVGMVALQPDVARAAPYAAMVMDARTGEVLHSRNADTRLHPASLTKMMTLYIAFEAVRNGEIDLDTMITVSRNAEAEPPSELGLRRGQKIALRYLIRAAAVKSANDAATAIGESISGSEAAFARRMNRTAKALGMTRTTFKNAHGLTASGHLSTARDMSLLGRHMLYDYPEYYNLFSRRSTNAGMKVVYNTNRRFLAAYRGADGIKTGYTRAAGFNLVSSAKRGDERIIATVFGGTSTAARNAKIAELLDLGFRRAPAYAKLQKPSLPPYTGNSGLGVRLAEEDSHGLAGKTIRVSGVISETLRPRARPVPEVDPAMLVAEAVVPEQDATEEVEDIQVAALDTDALQSGINSALLEVTEVSEVSAIQPVARPDSRQSDIEGEDALKAEISTAVAKAVSAPTPTQRRYTGPRPQIRPSSLETQVASVEEEPVVVTRLSTSGGRYWGINVGRYPNRFQAEKVLLRTALAEMETLDGSLRKVVQNPRGFDANFLGMTKEGAALACRRLNSRNVTCETLGPAS